MLYPLSYRRGRGSLLDAVGTPVEWVALRDSCRWRCEPFIDMQAAPSAHLENVDARPLADPAQQEPRRGLERPLRRDP
jgi:hypothetical protein